MSCRSTPLSYNPYLLLVGQVKRNEKQKEREINRKSMFLILVEKEYKRLMLYLGIHFKIIQSI